MNQLTFREIPMVTKRSNCISVLPCAHFVWCHFSWKTISVTVPPISSYFCWCVSVCSFFVIALKWAHRDFFSSAWLHKFGWIFWTSRIFRNSHSVNYLLKFLSYLFSFSCIRRASVKEIGQCSFLLKNEYGPISNIFINLKIRLS